MPCIVDGPPARPRITKAEIDEMLAGIGRALDELAVQLRLKKIKI